MEHSDHLLEVNILQAEIGVNILSGLRQTAIAIDGINNAIAIRRSVSEKRVRFSCQSR